MNNVYDGTMDQGSVPIATWNTQVFPQHDRDMSQ